jgi:hypothetical protein
VFTLIKKQIRKPVLLLLPLLAVVIAAWSCRDSELFHARQGQEPPEQARRIYRSAKRLVRSYPTKKDKVPAHIWRDLEQCLEVHRQTIRELEAQYPALRTEHPDE